MNNKTIPLKPTAARKRAIMLNDVIPGLLLLLNGIASFGDDSGHGNFALLNIAVGSAIVIAFIIEVKREGKTIHTLVHWFDVVAGIVLIVEGVNHWKHEKIFQPSLLYMILGMLVIIRGIFHARIPHLRKLEITEEGFLLRPNPIRKIHMQWNEVSSFELDGKVLVIKKKDGRVVKANLSRVENRDEVLEGLKG